jgi:hypothetical protein
MSMKNRNYTIGNRTGDFPPCSPVPEPTVFPCTPVKATRPTKFYVHIRHTIMTLVKQNRNRYLTSSIWEDSQKLNASHIQVVLCHSAVG